MHQKRRTFLKSQPFRAVANFRHSEKGLTIIETTLAIAIFAFLVVFCLGIFIYIGRVYYHGLYENRAQEVTRDIISTLSEALRTSGVEVEELDYTGTPGTNRDLHGWHGYCVGNVKYSYRLNTQLVDLDDVDQPPPLAYEPKDTVAPLNDQHDLHPSDDPVDSDVDSHKLNYDDKAFLVSRTCDVATSQEKALPKVIAVEHDGDPSTIVDINDSVELLHERMRIIYFSIKPTSPGDSSLYSVRLKIALGGYADDPEFDSETFVYERINAGVKEFVPLNDINSLGFMTPFTSPLNKVVSGEYQILRCRQGETFCAVSEAQTKVFRKIR